MSLEFAAIARKHFGEPNKSLSSKTELRFGTHGSTCVDLKDGLWFNHETDEGGSLYELPGEHWPVETRPNGNGAAHSNSDRFKNAKKTSKQFRIVKTWVYTDENGAELFEVCRLENGEIGADGKPDKTYRQRHRDATAPGGYIYSVKGIRQVPYRLPELIEAIAQSKTIFITEGEKCADAMIALGGAATCNAGGARKFRDELVPFFKGADVIVLPDNDEAGQSHLDVVSEKLRDVASRVRVLNLPGLKKPKDDIVDWIDYGGTLEQLHALVEADSSDTPEDATSANASDHAKAKQPAGFRMTPKGLLWVDPSDNEKPELVISGAFEVAAECRAGDGSSWGRLLRWQDADGRWHEWAMPVSLLAGDGLEVRKALLDGGMYVAAGGKARGLLTNYLASAHVEARACAVTTTGWHGRTFVLPNSSIGTADGADRVILQTAHFIDHFYNTHGTLAEWQVNIARYAEGNSRLTLAVSMAFAAALVSPCDAESGGIHLRGNSSIGKTTALYMAGSVWGGEIGTAKGFTRSWRSTANGLEGTAAIHNDALLCLDELGQFGGKEAGEAAYMLANGQGKARASRDATLRAPARWRLLFLSTGEISLADKMAEDMRGRRQTAGQQVRVVDLPSGGGEHGIFETLHDFTDPASLSDYLRSASAKFYGTAARAFIESISQDLDSVAKHVKARVAQFIDENCEDGTDGQGKRVAGRLGLIAAGGELAASLGILPWQPGSATQAAATCFHDWLECRGGKGASEDRDGIAAVRTFLSAHGLSRFEAAWECSGVEPKIQNLAGWRRKKEEGEGWDYFITAEAWAEVAAGFNKSALADTLAKNGFLLPGSSKKSKIVKVPGTGSRRAYHISHLIFEGDADA